MRTPSPPASSRPSKKWQKHRKKPERATASGTEDGRASPAPPRPKPFAKPAKGTPPKNTPPKGDAPLSRDLILGYIQGNPGSLHRRDLANALNVRGPENRRKLKELLRALTEEGLIERISGKRVAPAERLPDVTVLEITDIDADGDLLARPVVASGDTPPRIYVEVKRGQDAPGIGDRILARLAFQDDDTYVATVMRLLANAPAKVLGVVHKAGLEWRLLPTNRKDREEFALIDTGTTPLRHGDLVLAEVSSTRRLGLRQARVAERYASMDDPKAISLIAIHTHGIPTDFPPAALADCEGLRVPQLGKREDLRALPLVTIDGADARDFDDAVFAEPDADHPGGWHLIVAIADVAHYVPAGSALDESALHRGNSAYFPDRVVPMLPEALSNDLCSLRPNEDRACLAAHLWVDEKGHLKRWTFVRGLMRSHARLTYEQAEALHTGAAQDADILPIVKTLYAAYKVLAKARTERGTLDLDIPERKVKLNTAGRVEEIAPRARLDSHRLIEEFMILANVAAASALEGKGNFCLYRVHDQPNDEKLDSLRDFLATINVKLVRGQKMQSRHLADILDRVRDTPHAGIVSEVMLRSQAQAIYHPDNIGHFGLALPRYAHFTSPIRRYADLVVHRALIRVYKLGDDGLDDKTAARLEGIGEHLSKTERRAATAERDATDRYVAAYLADRVGDCFSGRISGVAKFGLFVRLDDSGADGLIPIATLPSDYYDHDEKSHALVGRRTGRSFRLTQTVMARIRDANPMTGGMIFEIVDGTDTAPRSSRKPPARKAFGQKPFGPKSQRGQDAGPDRPHAKKGAKPEDGQRSKDGAKKRKWGKVKPGKKPPPTR
jgi:ribonuclease R